MKNIFLFLLILSLLSCDNYEDYSNTLNVETPLELGEHIVYVNGEDSYFNSLETMEYFDQTKQLKINFSKAYRAPIEYSSNFSIIGIPVSKGLFKIKKPKSKENTDVSLSIYSGGGRHGSGVEYRYTNRKEGEIIISEIDKENHSIKGYFIFQMKITMDNGYSEGELGIPKFSTVEGVFYKTYK